jgi:hypothetical protein
MSSKIADEFVEVDETSVTATHDTVRRIAHDHKTHGSISPKLILQTRA